MGGGTPSSCELCRHTLNTFASRRPTRQRRDIRSIRSANQKHHCDSMGNRESSASGGVMTFANVFVRQWIDARDRDGKWFEAQIVSKDDRQETIRVHFKGYLSKWDENISSFDFASRLAPLNTHTVAPFAQVAAIQCVIGEEVQVQDTRGIWLEGSIVETDKPFGLVKIRYLGWTSRWDEWLNIDSYRLIPKDIPNSKCKNGAVDLDNEFRRFLASSMTLHTMDSDGNCLFKAISHQLYGDPQHHLLCRKAACSYMLYHKNKLANFVVGDFEQYVQRMQQPGVWGDELELRALSQVYHRPIWLFSVNDRETPLKISEPNVEQQTPMLLSYHLRSHYNSLTQQFWLKLNYRPGEWERTLELEYSLLQPE